MNIGEKSFSVKHVEKLIEIIVYRMISVVKTGSEKNQNTSFYIKSYSRSKIFILGTKWDPNPTVILKIIL